MSRGWGDLAYHFIVGVDGTVYEARDTRYEGATGTNYDPNGHFLMALEGNFDIDSAAQKRLDSLVTVLVWAATEFNVSPSTIAGHRDHATTACPGGTSIPTSQAGDPKQLCALPSKWVERQLRAAHIRLAGVIRVGIARRSAGEGPVELLQAVQLVSVRHPGGVCHPFRLLARERGGQVDGISDCWWCVGCGWTVCLLGWLTAGWRCSDALLREWSWCRS